MLCLEGDVIALRLVTLLAEMEKTKSVLLLSLLKRHTGRERLIRTRLIRSST